jgi:hypothetical protein
MPTAASPNLQLGHLRPASMRPAGMRSEDILLWGLKTPVLRPLSAQVRQPLFFFDSQKKKVAGVPVQTLAHTLVAHTLVAQGLMLVKTLAECLQT